MKRKQFLTLSSSLLLPSCLANQSKKSQPPNIILILADDMRWDALGVAGNRIIITPHLNNLAQTGLFFPNCFVTTSICATSRASIFTGQYARKHKIWDFETPLQTEQFSLTFPVLLKSAGYETGFVGKWGIGGKLPEDSFNFWEGFEGQGKYFQPQFNEQHLTDILTEKCLTFIKQQSINKPFFLMLSHKAPHAQDGATEEFQSALKFKDLYSNVTIPLPATATEKSFKNLPIFLQNSEARKRWLNRFSSPEKYQHNVKQYYRLITGIDESLGQIINSLTEKNLLDNTWIIFTSDNGFFLGEHGLADKWFSYEESIRIPLIIKPAQNFLNQNYGLLIPELVLNIDLAPTILSIAKVKIPSVMQGKNLLDLFIKNKQWRDYFIYEHFFKNPNYQIPSCEGVRNKNWKYVRYLIENNQFYEMLFNLILDPQEEQNLAQNLKYQDQLSIMRKQLERGIK